MFQNLFTNVVSSLRDMVGGISQFFKCRSVCCNNIQIYKTNYCSVGAEIKNRWTREVTPSVESPTTKKSQTVFLHLKINKILLIIYQNVLCVILCLCQVS